MAISSAISASAVARVVGIKTEFKDLRAGGIVNLPQRVAIFGQGASAATYPTTKQQITSAQDAANLYGFGSPIHLSTLQLFPTNGDGVGPIPVTVYPLEDEAGSAAATYTVTVTGAATSAAAFSVSTNNIDAGQFSVAVGESVDDIASAIAALINADLNQPVTASSTLGVVTLTAKWQGVSSNAIATIIEGPEVGVTFAITAATGGLIDPDVDDALAQMGDVWETMAINCLGTTEETNLDKFQNFGEGRWGALTKKPIVFLGGSTETTLANATAITDARKDDRVNIQLMSTGSSDLPFVVAARELARIVVVANDNPPRDYGSQRATGLTPGADGDQWDYVTRDAAVKAGTSTNVVRDGVVVVSDVVTMYHPEGDPVPAYRYLVDIVKLQNIIFNLNLIFATEDWDGAPLIPDDQPTTNPDAKSPKAARIAVYSMLDSLGLAAIISDADAAKAATMAEIDSQNPKRLNLSTTVKLSGNANIISIDLNFGFYFGGV